MISTISDVAKIANVSRATVSRVMNNPSLVSKKTREAVEKAIKELDFHPNQLGKKLRQSRSGLIMVLVTNLSSPYFSVVIDGIQTTAREYDYDVMLCQDSVDPQIAASYIRHLKQKTVDGLIIIDNTIDNTLLGDLDYQVYPVVQCSQYCENSPIPFVSVDDKAAMKKLVHYLVSTGRKRIALLNGDRRFIYPKSRLEGYIEALAECGIDLDESIIRYIDALTPQHSMIGVNDLFNSKCSFDAIIGVADIFAVAAIKVAHKNGFRVPQDLSIASFDNTDFTILSDPSITSISQPRYDLGVESFKMLLERIEDLSSPARQIFLDSDLIIRESTMPIIF